MVAMIKIRGEVISAAGGEQAAWDLDLAGSFRDKPVLFGVYSTSCEPPP